MGTTKKSTETRSARWFWRKARQVCEGGFERRGMSRPTVRCEPSRPSLRSSPWMRGAPPRGLARAMVRPTSATRAGYKSRPHEKHLAQISSSDTPVVVMEATKYGDCVDAPLCRERSWNRLLVPEGLVRTRYVVKADVLGDDAAEVILTEDEDVVEQLSPERTGEAFSEGIHVRRAYRRAHAAHPRRPAYASEASA